VMPVMLKWNGAGGVVLLLGSELSESESS
jgi:hypothetical protein